MYKCEITNKQSKLGEKLNKIVVKTRTKTYTKWVRDEDTRKWNEVSAGSGWEIVRELNATEAGVQLWSSYSAEEKESFLKRLG